MSKTAEGIFEKRFEKFRIGIFRLSLDHFLETGKLSGSALLEIREAFEEYAQQRVSISERLRAEDAHSAINEANGLRQKISELEQSNKELVEALEKITEMNYQTAEDKYGDRNKAKYWGCVVIAQRALSKLQFKEVVPDNNIK